MAIKLNLSEVELNFVDELKQHFNQSTASKAITCAITSHIDTIDKLKNTENELNKLRYQHNELVRALKDKKDAEERLSEYV